jgi:hypothetical protein
VSDIENIVSTTIRDNKLIGIYQISRTSFIKVRVFELKEGAVADIFKSRKLFDLGFKTRDFTLKFLDIPDNLQDDKNKVWLKFDYQGYRYPYTSQFINWVGYINLSDMSVENGSDFIKFPTYENFPIKGYTTNSIANKFGSALYIVGGELYSKKNDSYTVSNSFYKYNFTTKEWSDMTHSVEDKLKPLYGHKSVVIDNRYLVILGGRRPSIYYSNPSFYIKEKPMFEFNSLYNLTIFDSFTNNWETVNIKADILDTKVPTFQFIDFLATVYKDKIIIFGGMVGENGENSFISYEKMGTLDIKSKILSWTPILNEDGSGYKRSRTENGIQVLNDQLIICTGIPILSFSIFTNILPS